MSKSLRKAIMNRSKLKNKYDENRTDENWSIYKKHLRKTKKQYFNNLNIKPLMERNSGKISSHFFQVKA